MAPLPKQSDFARRGISRPERAGASPHGHSTEAKSACHPAKHVCPPKRFFVWAPPWPSWAADMGLTVGDIAALSRDATISSLDAEPW